jgi:ABC-2 type transport system permease protein
LFKELVNVVVKEVKELARDKKILIGMIIVPLIMFPLMRFAVRTSLKSAEESLKEISIAIWNRDNDAEAAYLIGNLSAHKSIQVFSVDVTNVVEAINRMSEVNATELIVIPEGFSNNVTARKRGENVTAKLECYSVFTGKGVTEGAKSSATKSLLGTYQKTLAPDLFVTHSKSIVKGNPVDVDPETLVGVAMSQFITLPIIVMMLILFAMQLAATSVASEKEEKTLETLLSLPISRFIILSGKLIGSVVVAAVGAVAYILGFGYYMSSFTIGFQMETAVNLVELGLAPSPLAYVLLGTSLFVSLVSALALAIIVSAFADDVRSAQAMVGYLYPVLFVPMIILMFTDINSLPLALRTILLAIPYTHPMLAARSMFTEDYLLVGLGIVYVAVFTVIVLFAAARLFATEKILTAKLRLTRLSKLKKKLKKP